MVSIKEDQNEYKNAVTSVEKYHFKTVEEMANEYKVIYDVLENGVSIDYEALKNIFKEEKKRSNVVVVNSNAQATLDEILRSAKWRFISKIKVPKFISAPAKKLLGLIKRFLGR